MTLFGQSRRGVSLNFPFAFATGVLIALTEILLHPTIILVFFVSELTDSLTTIALILTVGLLGWYVPQLITPWLARSSGRQMPWTLGASLVRAAAVIFLAYVGYRGDISDDERLRSFFICYLAYSVAAGFAHAPTNELIARSVNGERLGRLITQRNLWSGVLAIGAGFVARQALGPEGPGFPRDVTLLFIAAAAAVSGATFFLARIREPAPSLDAGKGSTVPRLGDLSAVLKDNAFQRFAMFGVIGGLATLADPFYVIYARREFDLPAEMIGTFLIVFAAGALLASPLWATVTRAGGARTTVQAATALRVVAPLVVLLVPFAVETGLYQDRVDNDRAIYYLFAVPFAVHGIALRGFVSGNFRYIAEIAVPDRKVAYQMLALSPLIIAAFAPLVGANIANRWGLDRLFLIAVFAGFFAILSGGLLANTSMRVRSSARSVRLRGVRP